MHREHEYDSDSSFDEENSIFSRPLKDLPAIGALDFVYEAAS